MANPVLSVPHFHNEEAAFAYVEAHLWPNGPVCPHCSNCDGARIGRLTGKTSRPGLRKCYACRKTFTVRIGSISRIAISRCAYGSKQFICLSPARRGLAPVKFNGPSIAA